VNSLSLLNSEPLKITVTFATGEDGKPRPRVEISGRTLDDLKAEARTRVAWWVRWGRHMMVRVGAAVVCFPIVAGLGPWPTAAYTLSLLLAGDLAFRLDLRAADAARNRERV
jgi:hypothetical protein